MEALKLRKISELPVVDREDKLLGLIDLTDLIGLDTTLAIADLLHDSFPEPQMQAPSLLRSMVRDGKLGRKSGEGFFSYPANGA